MTLLKIENLKVEYETDKGNLQAVDDVQINVEAGSIHGIVGESGCGKTTVAKSIIGLLDDNGKISDGEIIFKGQDITTLAEKELSESIRWNEISYIPQSAMASLDPVYRVGSQLIEPVLVHTNNSKKQAKEKARSLLELVNLDENVMNDYPHELSGGQKQRVIIALSLMLDPSLIIADEPTTGLDVIVQDAIIDLLLDIKEEMDCSILMVTHDMSAVAALTDAVTVMYAGRVAETGSTNNVFTEPSHPYTIGLKNSFPSLVLNPAPDSIVSIPGTPPGLIAPPTGCRFEERCPFSTDKCRMEPPDLYSTQCKAGSNDIEDQSSLARCHYINKSFEFREKGSDPKIWGVK